MHVQLTFYVASEYLLHIEKLGITQLYIPT